jgi:mannose-6-phosphate isomerase-like protein (cupin superfamily)
MSETGPAPPRIVRPDQWRAEQDELSPGCTFASFVHGEKQQLGLYFMPPGAKTNVFSLEDADDGAAEEYYGPCDEFYYVLVGEFTMHWGRDAADVRAGRSDKLLLKAGELGYWARGWKYSVENTGTAPGTFVWGLTFPPEGITRRSTLD